MMGVAVHDRSSLILNTYTYVIHSHAQKNRLIVYFILDIYTVFNKLCITKWITW